MLLPNLNIHRQSSILPIYNLITPALMLQHVVAQRSLGLTGYARSRSSPRANMPAVRIRMFVLIAVSKPFKHDIN